MRLRVFHRTFFEYENSVSESQNEVRLMPLTDDDQTCMHFRVSTSPNARMFSYHQPGGYVHHFNIRAPHDALEIIAESRVETRCANPFLTLNLVENDWAYYEQEEVKQDNAEFLAPTRLVPEHPEAASIAAQARWEAGESVASFLLVLTRHLHRMLVYEPGSTDVTTTLIEVLEEKSGVCQDFAHLMLAVCRSQGIPSRYISGYTYAGRRAKNSMRGYQATHAWIECLLPDGYWHGFDPTNNLLPNERYIKVQFGRDYSDVPPTRGIYRGSASASTPHVEVLVTAD